VEGTGVFNRCASSGLQKKCETAIWPLRPLPHLDQLFCLQGHSPRHELTDADLPQYRGQYCKME